MKKLLPLLLVGLLCFTPDLAKAQELGASFSFFLPRKGKFASPVAPLSIRGLGVSIGNSFSLQTGFSVYRMAGLDIKNLPYRNDIGPLTDPFFSLMVPLEGVIKVRMGAVKVGLRGGGFFFTNSDPGLHYGNLNQAIMATNNWDIATSQFDVTRKSGFGLLYGGDLTIYIADGLGIKLSAMYLEAEGDYGMVGTVTGGVIAQNITTYDADHSDAKLDYTGLELGLGVVFKTN